MFAELIAMERKQIGILSETNTVGSHIPPLKPKHLFHKCSIYIITKQNRKQSEQQYNRTYCKETTDKQT